MNINELFEKSDTFSAEVEITIPGEKADRKYRPEFTYRYLDQDQLDAYMDGEPVEIDGKLVEQNDDATMFDLVVVKWARWKVDGEDLEYTEENHAMARKHGPIRAPVIAKYFDRLAGGNRGGRRGRRKN